MSAEPSNVIPFPVRRRPPPAAPLSYEVVAVQGAVMVAIGEVELWLEPDEAVRFGTDLVQVGTTAK